MLNLFWMIVLIGLIVFVLNVIGTLNSVLGSSVTSCVEAGYSIEYCKNLVNWFMGGGGIGRRTKKADRLVLDVAKTSCRVQIPTRPFRSNLLPGCGLVQWFRNTICLFTGDAGRSPWRRLFQWVRVGINYSRRNADTKFDLLDCYPLKIYKKEVNNYGKRDHPFDGFNYPMDSLKIE